jgi:hypothetical protein
MHRSSFDHTITKANLFDSHQAISDSHKELEDESHSSLNEDALKKPHEKRTYLGAIYKTFKYIYFCPILFATTWMIIYLEYNSIESDRVDFG